MAGTIYRLDKEQVFQQSNITQMDETTQGITVIPEAGAVHSMTGDELRQLVRLLVSKGVTQRYISDKAGYDKAGARLAQFLKAAGVDAGFETFTVALKSALALIISERFSLADTTARKFQRMETSVTQDLFNAARICQNRGMMGYLTGPGGSGKTTSAKMYAAQTMNVVYVACNELMGRPYDLIRRVAKSLDIYERSRYDSIQAILDRLSMSRALLLVDEADVVPVSFLSALRIFNDEGGIGMLFVGQEGLQRTLRSSVKSHRYLTSRFRHQEHTRAIGMDDVRMLAESVLGPLESGVVAALRAASAGVTRDLETLCYALHDFAVAGEVLGEKLVKQAAESVLILH